MKAELMIVDGELRAVEEVRISPLDLGFSLGDGLFETLRVAAGEARYFERHYARLAGSAARLGLEVPGEEELRSQVGRLVEATGRREGRLRVTLSAGEPGAGFARVPGAGRCLLTLTELPAMSGEAARLLTSPFRRLSGAWSGGMKSLSYGESQI
ncbi:MAG: aminotransferase class IV, partial [Verrucomicrobiales bacterium]